jgi:hypothetical protein
MTATLSPAHDTVAAAPTARSAIPFTRLLRVEWFKAIDTRASRWLLAVVGAVTVAAVVAGILRRFSQPLR